MKKITSVLFAVFCLLAMSCDKEEDRNSAMGELKLSGTVMAPNNAFAISRATVKVFQNNSVIAQKTTDAVGTFVIENLPEGPLTVELSKGKFKKEISLNMTGDYTLAENERNFDIFPKIGVVTGAYDDIEDLLIEIGLVTTDGSPAFDIIEGYNFSDRFASSKDHDGHGHGPLASNRAFPTPSNVSFNMNDLVHDAELLADYDIIFLNCGAKESYANDPVAIANLVEFVDNGGIIYATDWMYKYLKNMFVPADYLAFSTPEKAGNSTTATAQVLNDDLIAWLAAQGITIDSTVQINEFVGGWQMVDSFNSTNVIDWLVAESVIYNQLPVANKSLAFTFEYGDGGVFYSSFHTHGTNSQEIVVQMMNYFVFELASL